MPSQGVCESDGQWHIAETPAVRGALAPTSRGNLLQYDPWVLVATVNFPFVATENRTL